MPIILVTGLPGHGKTLYTLHRWKTESERDGRPVFHASGTSEGGIPGLKLAWQVWDPRKWFELPANALMIVDEAQRVFPIRPRSGEVPEHVEQLETHRHLGLDLVLVTQDPMLLDPHVRRLVDRHFHVVRKFGTSWATVHEFPTGCRDNVSKSRKDAIRHEWKFPSEVFEWYQSAEVHTVKRRIPARVWLLGGLPFLFLGAAGYAAWHLVGPGSPLQGVPLGAAPGATSSVPAGDALEPGSPARGRAVGGVRDWLSERTPRVAGLEHTAPIYDKVTEPVVAPYPAACVSMRKRCSCYSQQGTVLAMAVELCEQIVQRGYFVAWRQPDALPPAAPASAAAEVASMPPAAASGVDVLAKVF